MKSKCGVYRRTMYCGRRSLMITAMAAAPMRYELQMFSSGAFSRSLWEERWEPTKEGVLQKVDPHWARGTVQVLGAWEDRGLVTMYGDAEDPELAGVLPHRVRLGQALLQPRAEAEGPPGMLTVQWI